MAKKKDEEPVVEVASEGAADAPAAEAEVKDTPAKGSNTEITVKYRDHKGEPIERTFSKEEHGADFAKLADEFKATNASRIIE